MNPQIFTTQLQKLLIHDRSYFIFIPTYLLCLQVFLFVCLFVCLIFPSEINLFNLFLFYFGVELINNAVLVPGIQQTDSVIHIHVSILFQILFPFRLLQSTEQSSLN